MLLSPEPIQPGHLVRSPEVRLRPLGQGQIGGGVPVRGGGLLLRTELLRGVSRSVSSKRNRMTTSLRSAVPPPASAASTSEHARSWSRQSRVFWILEFGFWIGKAQTASAASSVQPPWKTESWAKKRCSSEESS